jgi:hypothetical protein
MRHPPSGGSRRRRTGPDWAVNRCFSAVCCGGADSAGQIRPARKLTGQSAVLSRCDRCRGGCYRRWRVTCAASWVREAMSSLTNTYTRWVCTVRREMYCRSPICGLVSPVGDQAGDGLLGRGHAGPAETRPSARPAPAAAQPGRAQCPGPGTPAVDARAARAHSARRQASRPPRLAAPVISGPRSLSALLAAHGPPGTGRTPGPAARGRAGRKYSAAGARPWQSVKKPTVRTDRPGGPDAIRYTSVDTATHRPTVTHRDTRRDKKKTARRTRFRSQRAVYAGGGRCWVRTNVG